MNTQVNFSLAKSLVLALALLVVTPVVQASDLEVACGNQFLSFISPSDPKYSVIMPLAGITDVSYVIYPRDGKKETLIRINGAHHVQLVDPKVVPLEKLRKLLQDCD